MKKLVAVLSLSILATACLAEEDHRPDIVDLEQGLNILDAEDPAWGMAAAFVDGDKVIYFESRVGTMKPHIYTLAAPDQPAHEMDWRFVDQQGRTFYSQRGGDFFVDPTWGREVSETLNSSEVLPIEELDVRFAMAQKATEALFKTHLADSFADHVVGTKMLLNEQLPSQRPLPERDPELQSDRERAYWNWDWVDGNQWFDAHLYKGKVGCFAWVCGYHSAVKMLKGYPNYLWVSNACNHGRCYYHSGMSYQCMSFGYHTTGGWTTGEENGDGNGAGTAINGACSTGYNWHSGGADHLCNSDSSYEMWQMKDGTYQTSRGNYSTFTYDSGGHNYACNCNNNDDCDGDWKTPACP